MRILWHSAAPWVSGGYGRVCQEVITRLQNESDHQVGVQCLTAVKKDPVMWHGEVWDGDEFTTPRPVEEPIPVFPSSSTNANTHFGVREAKQHYNDFDADFYFTHFDTWMSPAREIIPDMEIPYGSYVIVDHYPAPNEVVEQVTNAYETVGMSRFARSALMERGVRSRYIPHGVDTEQYRPMDEDERPSNLVMEIDGEQKELDLNETFVFGMIAANYADRKNIPNHMEAFKRFIDNVDEDAILYMHMWQKSDVGYDLYRIQQDLGIPDRNIAWIPPDLYHDVGDVTLNAWYNNMNVLLNATMGESWGLTITESMACGTPAIVSNFSSMPEQVGFSGSDGDSPGVPNPYDIGEEYSFREGNHGLVVRPRMHVWREKVSSKQYICHPEDIYVAMRYYYDHPELIEEHGEKARNHVVSNYDWDECILPQFIEMFDQLEEILV